MNVVVFGGAGFLGSYLTEALLQNKKKVTVFDLKPSKIKNPSCHSIIGDITDPKKVSAAIKRADIVYNLAGMSDIEDCIHDPVEAVKLNILGNTILLQECVKAKVKRFLLASTLYVYSSSGGVYRSTKQACESLVEDYNKYYNLKFTILRYGTPYGPGAGSNNSVYRFLRQASDGRKIEYHGTGDEIREYIHAHDAAVLSIKALEPQFENERVVLSGPYPIKVSDFLSMINEILGKSLSIKYMNEGRKVPDTHYQITPYSYNPKIAKKLVSDAYLDLGQGILDCIEAIKKEKRQ